MSNPAPVLVTPPTTKGEKERKEYRTNLVVSGLREMARATDAELEEAIAEFVASLDDDGVIDEQEAKAVLVALLRAFKCNVGGLNVLNLFDESGSEAALREMERLQAKKRLPAVRRTAATRGK